MQQEQGSIQFTANIAFVVPVDERVGEVELTVRSVKRHCTIPLQVREISRRASPFLHRKACDTVLNQ